jgi:hypothetical protein
MMTLVVLGGTHGVFTQTATTALSGTVVDETGAVIQGVLVRVTNSGTGLVRELTTNTDGYFTAPLLPPGKYHVQTQHDGFAPGEVRDVDLHVNDHMVIKLVLKLAAIGEVVTVAAAEAPVRVVPSVGTIIPRALVDTMPLNGRTFQSLIMLTPGVVVTNAFGGDQGQFSVNGQRANANNFIIDGVSANFSVGFGALLQGGVGSLPAAPTTWCRSTRSRSSTSRPRRTRPSSAGRPARRCRS